MNPCMFPATMRTTITYTVAHAKSLPAPTVRKLLRERGLTMADVARAHGCAHSVVSRVVRKQVTSNPVWTSLVAMLNKQELKAS